MAAAEWKWELTAAGAFAVNTACFPMVSDSCSVILHFKSLEAFPFSTFFQLLGALATCVTFTVQLQLSENTSKLAPSACSPKDCFNVTCVT